MSSEFARPTGTFKNVEIPGGMPLPRGQGSDRDPVVIEQWTTSAVIQDSAARWAEGGSRVTRQVLPRGVPEVRYPLDAPHAPAKVLRPRHYLWSKSSGVKSSY